MSNPKVSIIINNYNYGLYINDAIKSALEQDYPNVEVIVVDDGSVDNSVELIEQFGSDIATVLKDNGGQASAFNAGLKCASGDIVFFLDSDDFLDSTIVSRAVTEFQNDPTTVRVQFRLGLVDAEGAPLQTTFPSQSIFMESGDFTQQVLSHPDDLLWQPTSGNAFHKNMLDKIFPMPEAEYKICADYYLQNLSGLFGKIRSLNEVGAFYRIHGENNHQSRSLNLSTLRDIITRTRFTHVMIKKYAQSLDLSPDQQNQEDDFLSVTYLANRIISQKLHPVKHPIKTDSLWGLYLKALRISIFHPFNPIMKKLFHLIWFTVFSISPSRVSYFLAEGFLFEEKRNVESLLTHWQLV